MREAEKWGKRTDQRVKIILVQYTQGSWVDATYIPLHSSSEISLPNTVLPDICDYTQIASTVQNYPLQIYIYVVVHGV
jgi:hypothetical protein